MMAHSDNGEIYAMPYEKIATMTFLDDDSALQYLPGTHLRHFLEADGQRCFWIVRWLSGMSGCPFHCPGMVV